LTSNGYGEAASPTGPLTRVLVREPADAGAWREYGWRAKPDPAAMRAEHDGFCERLREAGADVVVGTTPVPGNPDAVYVRDTTLVAPAGAIPLRPGKPGRRSEPPASAADLDAAGVPVQAAMPEPATAEGGDMFWLDDATLLVGRSYRTNDDGIACLRERLPGVDVLAFDLPHLRGASEVLHLMSLISPLDRDLAVAFPPLMPARLVALLQQRGIRLVEVPEEEFESMGPNVLALGPRVALAVEGNPQTRRRMQDAGVDVRAYRGDEISAKGDGGPTCLTLPLSRGA
jgi:N-dimethylarginine dimethylaminohydrolase